MNSLKSQTLKMLWVSGLAFSLGIGWTNYPSWAGDPFRQTSPKNIGDQTEYAFELLFAQGDYKGAKDSLKSAIVTEADEPLAHALMGSLAYTEEDWETLKTQAQKTLQAAKKLSVQDPVRGNLYLAVANFLEGAYVFEKQGPLGAINKLQQVFAYLDKAEELDPQDPELNLIKGYMDLLLAVNLPFSTPDQAIDRLTKFASPDYLVNRGIAVAYRDLDKLEQAIVAVDSALKATPDNPELYYLKGQILYKMAKKQQNVAIFEEALTNFAKALTKSHQLPKFITKSLKREHRKTQEKIQALKTG
ncbi:MAG: tetratricopeptide repeat protein [Cyanobacteria bacterium J083]|nr:MAG: tetratricopeptide repeat protein [Cyanobacteria bacterium J083]